MKAKTVVKIFLDVAMTVLYALLMFGYGITPLFHELAGIGTGILFILHYILNFGALNGMIHAAKTGRIKPLRGALLFLDLVLPVGMAIVIATGVLMARAAFMLPTASAADILLPLHNVTSWVVLGILVLHLVLHAKYLINVLRALFKNLRLKEVKRALASVAAGAMALAFCYVLVANALTPQSEEQTEALPSTVTENQIQNSNGNGKSGNDSSYQSGNSSASDGEAVTSLAEYLSKLFCTGCHKHCPLSSPQCAVGVKQAEEATVDYDEQYGN